MVYRKPSDRHWRTGSYMHIHAHCMDCVHCAHNKRESHVTDEMPSFERSGSMDSNGPTSASIHYDDTSRQVTLSTLIKY